MSDILSIEEFVNKQSLRNFEFEEGYFIDEINFRKALKEFADLHVQAALKVASKKAILSIDGFVEKWNGQRYFVDKGNHYSETEIEISKDSILNAYPLTNIK